MAADWCIMPRFDTGAAPLARESEWETFRRLITHDDRNSYYVVSSCSNGTWEDVAVRKGNLAVLGFSDASSYYMTHNGFFEPNRKSESARQLNALFFDLDCHDRPISEVRSVVERTIRMLENAVDSEKLPAPTMVIDSGRGVQLFYVLKRSVPTYSNGEENSKSITFFKSVQSRMMDVLEHLLKDIDGISVDRATGDFSRVSRIPGTYNHAAGRAARLVEASNRFHSLSDLSSFAAKYLIENAAEHTTRTAIRPRATMLHYKPLMMSRLSKVIELQAYRHFRCEGERELMSFVFYNTAVQIYSRVDAKNRLRAFNARFVSPLAESELVGIERSVDNVVNYQGQEGFYLIGAQRLTELLGLTAEENEAISFFESKRAILRAQAKRDTAQKRRDRNERIVELRRTTRLTQREIANEVGVSLRTVASVLSKQATNQRFEKIQAFVKKQEERTSEAIRSYNKEYEHQRNKQQYKTCNFLSHVFLEYSPVLGSPSGASSFPLPSHKEFPVTRTFVPSTSVTGNGFREDLPSFTRGFSLFPLRAP